MPGVPFQGGFLCIRGPAARPKRCKCGREGTKLCDFPLRGRKAGQTCDRVLCDSCAVSQAPGVDYCRPHDTVTRQGVLL